MTGQKRSRAFAELSILKLFKYCVLPGAVSMASSALYIVVDGMFVGHMLGSEALAAITVMWPLLMICFGLSELVGEGASVQIASLLGKRKPILASRTLCFALSLITLGALAGGLCCYLLSPLYLRLLGLAEDTQALSLEYMLIYCCFAPLVALHYSVDNFLRACALQKYSMALNVVVALLNLLLDYIFIVRLQCGVWSASFTTCLSLSAGAVGGLWPFLAGRTELRFTLPVIPVKRMVRLICLGLPSFFDQITTAVLMLLVNSLLLTHGGETAVAANAAVMYLDSVVFMLLYGLNNALQPALSYCQGAGLGLRVRLILRYLLLNSALICGVAFVLMTLGASYVIPLYARGEDADFIELGVLCMHLFSLSYLTLWVGLCLGSFLTSVDCPRAALILSVLRSFVYPVLALLVLVPIFKLTGIWLCEPTCSALSALTAVVITHRLWQQIFTTKTAASAG